MTGDELRRQLGELLDSGELDEIRPPGLGSTADRHLRLVELGRRDLSLARMAEPHADARAILSEAGRDHLHGALYGVWASESPAHDLTLRCVGGSHRLDGSKAFCGGAQLCDRALVTTTDADGSSMLVEVDLAAGRAAGTLRIDASQWSTPAFASTGTAEVTFEQHAVADADLIGGDRFYLDRPGFWHGALGPAAVWVGGAIGLVDHAEKVMAGREEHPDGASTHDRVRLGALRALRWAMLAQLDTAASEIDLDPGDQIASRARALTVRHLIDRQAGEVIDLFARTVGPRSLAFDADVVRRHQELQLYLRQSHGTADLELIGGPPAGVDGSR